MHRPLLDAIIKLRDSRKIFSWKVTRAFSVQLPTRCMQAVKDLSDIFRETSDKATTSKKGPKWKKKGTIFLLFLGTTERVMEAESLISDS